MSSPATSDGFNPFSTWQCPHCQRWFDGEGGNNGASTPLFYRGSCRHVVCITCIAQVLSRVSKKVKSEVDEGQPIIVAVTCPLIIDHCQGKFHQQCRGQFQVDTTIKYCRGTGSGNTDIIDLCSKDEGEPANATTVKKETETDHSRPITVKREGQAIASIKTEAFQPEPVLSVASTTSDSDGYDDETIFLGETLSDPFDVQAGENAEEQNFLKRRRLLDPSLEEKLHRTDFWSVNQDHSHFTEQAFMKNPLFHLNSFLDSEKKVNEGFSEFIREGIATPGVEPLPLTLDIEKIASWSEAELTQTLTTLNNSDWDATKTAQWLKTANVGSFVVMRHEYPNCPFCPKRLINAEGKYIGPVYVIGVITKKVVPWSTEERDIAENKMGDFSRNVRPVSTVCRVHWQKMGLKANLQESTKRYMNSICQRSFRQICKPGKLFACGATPENIRRDLWMKATEEISSDEFPDRFRHGNMVA